MTQKNSEASSLLSFSLPSDPSTSITVSLLGGTLISWKVKGQEQLYVSPISEPCFEKAAILMTNDTLSDASSPKTKSNNYPRKPIRGGVPLVFPVFGKSDAFPWQHGFARNLLWRHEWTLASFGKSQDSHEDDGHASEAEDDSGSSCSEVQSTVSDDDFYGAQASQTTFVFPKENYTGENITLQLALNTNDLAKAAASLRHTFPFEFELYVILKLYKASLKMTFQVHNLAESTQPLPFSALFHSYFAVSDIANISIEGLSGCPFSDKLTVRYLAAIAILFIEARFRMKVIARRKGRNWRSKARLIAYMWPRIVPRCFCETPGLETCCWNE